MRRQDNIKIDIWDLDRYPDIERHRLLITGRVVRPKFDPRITITIPAHSSEEHGDIITLVSALNCGAAINISLQLHETLEKKHTFVG